MSYIEFHDVKKIYKMGDVKIKALSGADFTIEQGEFAVIAGPSGAGKSTILNLLGGMDTCTTGEIIVDGKHVEQFNAKELTTYRRYDIGFVFQFYNLVQNLTVLENVELATQICKNPLDVEETIRAVDLGDRMKNFPSQLSGGEQQRVSIARALAKNPKLLLCDEPTGSVMLVQHYPKFMPVILFSLSTRISLMTERHKVRFSSRVKVSYIFLKSVSRSLRTAAKSGGASVTGSGSWLSAAVYIS